MTLQPSNKISHLTTLSSLCLKNVFYQNVFYFSFHFIRTYFINACTTLDAHATVVIVPGVHRLIHYE